MEQQKQMLGGCLMPMMTAGGGAGGDYERPGCGCLPILLLLLIIGAISALG